MALLAGREVLLVMASVVAPFHIHFRQINRSFGGQRIERMRLMAVVAVGSLLILFRIVGHESMGIGLLPAGGHILGGGLDHLGEGPVALQALILRRLRGWGGVLGGQNPDANARAASRTSISTSRVVRILIP